MQPDEYTPLKDYLNNVLESFPDETELEDIMRIALRQDSYEANKGYLFKRTETNPREMAFYEQWKKENLPMAGVNYGNGILQDLFIETTGVLTRKWVTEITDRDRMIAATVIQWLGTNVGMGFLHASLARFNAYVAYK